MIPSNHWLECPSPDICVTQLISARVWDYIESWLIFLRTFLCIKTNFTQTSIQLRRTWNSNGINYNSFQEPTTHFGIFAIMAKAELSLQDVVSLYMLLTICVFSVLNSGLTFRLLPLICRSKTQMSCPLTMCDVFLTLFTLHTCTPTIFVCHSEMSDNSRYRTTWLRSCCTWYGGKTCFSTSLPLSMPGGTQQGAWGDSGIREPDWATAGVELRYRDNGDGVSNVGARGWGAHWDRGITGMDWATCGAYGDMGIKLMDWATCGIYLGYPEVDWHHFIISYNTNTDSILCTSWFARTLDKYL